MGDLTTFKRIQTYVPGLTEYRFKMARRHSLQYRRGAELSRTRNLRTRVQSKQLDHFFNLDNECACHPRSPIGAATPPPLLCEDTRNSECHQDHDSEQASKAIQTGLNGGNKFSSIQPKLLRVLSACAAAVRKSLQGLDYVTADSAKGFEDTCVMVENLKEKGLDRETAKGWDVALKEGKQYLKALRYHSLRLYSAFILITFLILKQMPLNLATCPKIHLATIWYDIFCAKRTFPWQRYVDRHVFFHF